MTTITKERIELFVKSPLENGLTRGEQMELARIALASLDAETVRYLNKFSGTCVTLEQQPNAADDVAVYIPLYAAPPVPVVPEGIPKGLAGQIVSLLAHNIGDKFLAQKIWNACRAAMLQGGEPVSETYNLPEEKGASLQLRNLIRKRHAEWSDSAFGNVGPVGPLKHLSKEALEAAAEPGDLSEWADMQFLLWDAQRRAGISDGEITAAMEEKLKVNMARQWPEPKDGEPRLHIKEQPAPVVPDGYALVPVEPTDEMIAAAMNCEDVLFNSDESFCVQFGNIYEAMLAAAPQPEASDGK
ncbi:DUF550 domain-containing protein [Salmonella enterica]